MHHIDLRLTVAKYFFFNMVLILELAITEEGNGKALLLCLWKKWIILDK